MAEHVIDPLEGKRILLFCTAVFASAIYLLSLTNCVDCDVPVTPEEAKSLKSHITIDDVDFDVPWLYNHWPNKMDKPAEGLVFFDGREEATRLSFQALLPDVETHNGSNTSRFGWKNGAEIAHIRLSRRSKEIWKRRFDSNTYRSIIWLPESQMAPSMFRYKHSAKYSFGKTMYINNKKLTDNLIRISCSDPTRSPSNSSSCKMESFYHKKLIIEVTFSSEYLPKWQEIDRKIKVLLDKCLVSTNTNMNKT